MAASFILEGQPILEVQHRELTINGRSQHIQTFRTPFHAADNPHNPETVAYKRFEHAKQLMLSALYGSGESGLDRWGKPWSYAAGLTSQLAWPHWAETILRGGWRLPRLTILVYDGCWMRLSGPIPEIVSKASWVWS